MLVQKGKKKTKYEWSTKVSVLAECPRLLYKDSRASPEQTQEENNDKHLELKRATDCTMRLNTLFFLLVLSGLCLALAQTTYDDCCLKYVKQLGRNTQRHAVEYRWQVPDGGCNIPAVIFTMRRGREFCTDPREAWVGELMKKINDKGKGRF